MLTHVCLGSCYAWSVINEPIIRSLGVVTSASADWTLASIAPVFSLMFLIHGLSAAVLGKWQERVGPRAAGTVLLFEIFCSTGELCFTLLCLWLLVIRF